MTVLDVDPKLQNVGFNIVARVLIVLVGVLGLPCTALSQDRPAQNRSVRKAYVGFIRFGRNSLWSSSVAALQAICPEGTAQRRDSFSQSQAHRNFVAN